MTLENLAEIKFRFDCKINCYGEFVTALTESFAKGQQSRK